MTAQAPCRICRKPVTLDVEDITPPEFQRMFLGAICHDVCLELRKRRDAAIQKIASACNHMSVIKSRGNKIPEDSLAIYKGSIENGLREYIAVIDDFYKRPATPFDDQIVTWFNIQPHNWQKLLKDIRESLKEKVHA